MAFGVRFPQVGNVKTGVMIQCLEGFVTEEMLDGVQVGFGFDYPPCPIPLFLVSRLLRNIDAFSFLKMEEAVNCQEEPIGDVLTRVRNLVNQDTAAIIEYIHTENAILREMLGTKRLRFTEHQRRRLVKAGVDLKDRLHEFATLVKPETILRWHRRLKQKKWDYSKRRSKVGRPKKSDNTRELVLRLADKNGWGYERIRGELAKLGHSVGSTTVARLLKENGYPIAPHRKGMSWKDFIQSHKETLWSADMFTEEVVTIGGLVTVYVLFFVHLATRRVYIAGCTPTPNAEWMKQQARQFTWMVRSPVEPDEDDDDRPRCRFVVHDRDSSFLPLDEILRSQEIEPKLTPPQAPNANAFAERFVREARETLDNLIIFGEHRLHQILKKIERHHNECRPHQGIDNAIPLGYDYPPEPAAPKDVRCDSELGGLLRHYYVDEEAA